MLKRIYVILGSLVVASFAAAGFAGWEFPSGTRQVLPANVRNAPGGYRSYHFWHSGLHGGK